MLNLFCEQCKFYFFETNLFTHLRTRHGLPRAGVPLPGLRRERGHPNIAGIIINMRNYPMFHIREIFYRHLCGHYHKTIEMLKCLQIEEFMLPKISRKNPTVKLHLGSVNVHEFTLKPASSELEAENHPNLLLAREIELYKLPFEIHVIDAVLTAQRRSIVHLDDSDILSPAEPAEPAEPFSVKLEPQAMFNDGKASILNFSNLTFAVY